jgi:hypothetical protein
MIISIAFWSIGRLRRLFTAIRIVVMALGMIKSIVRCRQGVVAYIYWDSLRILSHALFRASTAFTILTNLV